MINPLLFEFLKRLFNKSFQKVPLTPECPDINKFISRTHHTDIYEPTSKTNSRPWNLTGPRLFFRVHHLVLETNKPLRMAGSLDPSCKFRQRKTMQPWDTLKDEN